MKIENLLSAEDYESLVRSDLTDEEIHNIIQKKLTKAREDVKTKDNKILELDKAKTAMIDSLWNYFCLLAEDASLTEEDKEKFIKDIEKIVTPIEKEITTITKNVKKMSEKDEFEEIDNFLFKLLNCL